MTASTVRLGRYRTSPDPDYAEVGDGQQRAYIPAYLSQTIILYRLGAWLGKAQNSPSTRLGIAYTSSDGSSRWPGTRITYTDAITPSVAMTSWDGGAHHYKNLATPVVLTPAYYSLVVTSKGGMLGMGMIQAASISETYESFWTKWGLSSTVPTNPVEGTASNEGHLSIYGEGELNVAPDTPTGLSPSGNIAGGTLTPTLLASFSDDNEVLNNGVAYDRLERVQVEVLNGGTVVYSTEREATSTERTNRQSSQVTSTLAYNITYTYRVRHRDRVGAWSNWASTTFTIQSLGSVEQPSSPAGFKTSPSNPGNIVAIYRNTSGLSTNAVQARVLSSGGAVLLTGVVVAKTVAPNGTITLTWAESGIGTLAYGDDYQVQVRARDSAGNWSLAWSTPRAFWINAAPATPSNLSPKDSDASSSYPLLTCSVSDPDPEHPTPGLVVKARIKNSSGTVLQTRTMTYNATSDKFQYQTTAADLAAYGTFKWDAYSFDGSLYSGTTTVEASATTSAEATFVYAAGPAVTLLGPTSPIATISPTVSWSAAFTGGATQRHYRIRLLHPSSGVVVYDTMLVLSAATSAPITSSNWIGGEQWNNGETFNLRVTVYDTNDLVGSSADTPITLTYTQPPALTLDGIATSLTKTAGTNAVLLTWQLSSLPSSEFAGYEVWRTEWSGTEPVPGTRVRLRRIMNAASIAFLDAEVTSGTIYRWELIQRQHVGNDTLESPSTEWYGGVLFDGVILHMPHNPELFHVALRYGPDASPYAPSVRMGHTKSVHAPIGGGRRAAFFGPGTFRDPRAPLGLITDEYSSADDKLHALLSIFEAQSGAADGLPHTVCWREGRGGSLGRLYGVLDDNYEITSESHNRYGLALALIETGFVLGE